MHVETGGRHRQLDVEELGGLGLQQLGLPDVLEHQQRVSVVARLDAGKAAILLLAELVVGVVSAVLIGGEDLSPQEALGGALILAAAVIEACTESIGQTA